MRSTIGLGVFLLVVFGFGVLIRGMRGDGGAQFGIERVEVLPVRVGMDSGRVSAPYDVLMANGESELIVFRVTAIDKSVPLKIEPIKMLPDGLTVERYWVAGQGQSGSGYLDKLTPVSTQGIIMPRVHTGFLVWKLRTAAAQTAFRHRERIVVNVRQGISQVSASFDVVFFPVSLDSKHNKLYIQANAQVRGAKLSRERRWELYRDLVSDGMSGLLLDPRDYSGEEIELDLRSRAKARNSEFVLRIPSLRLLHRTRVARIPISTDVVDTLVRSSCRYLNRQVELLRAEGYSGSLSFKFWDEPDRSQFDLVRRAYRKLRYCDSGVMLDLGKNKVPGLEDIVGIWETHVETLESDQGSLRSRGRHLLYANHLHGLEQPRGAMRAIGWIAWAYGLNGYHFWSLFNWPQDVTVLTPSRQNVFGRGTFYYLGEDGAVVYRSFRMEMFWQGVEDYHLLHSLQELVAASPLDKYCDQIYEDIQTKSNVPEIVRYVKDRGPGASGARLFEFAKIKRRVLEALIKCGHVR